MQGFFVLVKGEKMNCVLKNGTVYINGKFVKTDLSILNGKLSFSVPQDNSCLKTIDCLNKFIFPGFVDVHVHLREPGFSYKETIKTGTEAGASAGYSALFSMPNLNPVPDTKANLQVQLEIIEKDAVVNVYPYASITVGQKGERLSDLEDMKDDAIAFSDDGRGVQSEELMKSAMEKAKKLNKIIVAHCEVNELLNDGYIHDGEYAKTHGHKGICSASEYKQIERDVGLVEQTGVKYHVCHVSAKESVDIIRNAKLKGLDVTAETAPHYLVFSDKDLQESGNFKMNPPIRGEEDRLALIEGVLDGTLDMIATDHAPHSFEEKSKGLKGSLNGIVGLETAFPVMYSKLVKTGILSLEKLIEVMSINPAKRFGLKAGIEEGELASLCVFDLEKEYEINPEKFKSKGKSTPFNRMKVFGECVLNIVNGKTVWEKSPKSI